MSWWNTDRLDLLEQEAISWLGTPFAPNSCSKGFGVSCAKLCGALYEASGYGPIEVPDGRTTHARFSDESIIIPFFDNRDDFEQVDILDRQAGDVIGIRIGKCVHHLGVMLSEGRFVHAMDKIGVTIGNTSDPTWLSRMDRVWRPKV